MIHGPLVFDVANTIADFALDTTRLAIVPEAIVAAYHAVLLEDAEIDLFDLVGARLLLTPLTNAVRRHETPDEPNYMAEYGEDAIDVCLALEKIGRQAFTDRARVALVVYLSHNRRPDIDSLIARRKATMGSKLYVFYDPPLHMVKGEGVWLIDDDRRQALSRLLQQRRRISGIATRMWWPPSRASSSTLNTNTRYLGRSGSSTIAERLTATTAPACSGPWPLCTPASKPTTSPGAWPGPIPATPAASQWTSPITASRRRSTPFSPSGNYANKVPPHIRALTPPDGYRGQYRYGTNDMGRLYAADADKAIASLDAAGLKTAAFMIDSALMTNGVLEPVPGYVADVFKKVRAAGGLCIADEVQSGFGRMGTHSGAMRITAWCRTSSPSASRLVTVTRWASS